MAKQKYNDDGEIEEPKPTMVNIADKEVINAALIQSVGRSDIYNHDEEHMEYCMLINKGMYRIPFGSDAAREYAIEKLKLIIEEKLGINLIEST